MKMIIFIVMFLVSSTYASDSCELLLVKLETTKRVSENTVTTTITAKSGAEVIGSFLYHTTSGSPGEIKVGDVEVDKKYKGRGVLYMLYKEAVDRNPNVIRMSSMLLFDNLKAFQKAWDELDYIYDKNKRCAEAVKHTPAYKIRAKLGFLVVDECEYVGNILVLFGSRKP